MSIKSDIQKLEPGSIVELYIIDTTEITDINGQSGQVDRYHNGVNELGLDVVWNGDTYTRFPIAAGGFSMSGDGVLPRPTLGISNINGLMGALSRQYNDFIGAKVTRIRTFLRYLDAINFPGGVNLEADPNAKLPDEIYKVDRKAAETAELIEFELTAAWDVQGKLLPGRRVIKSSCPFKYRGPECGYTGAAAADINDNLTSDLSVDSCGKRLSSCKLRFSEQLPFGGFLNVGRSY